MSTTENLTQTRLLIGGELLEADAGPDVINPATGEHLAQSPSATGGQLDDAVAAAKAAAPAWGAAPDQRAEVLKTIASVIEANSGELARLLTLEVGVPVTQTVGEVGAAAAFIRHRAANTLRDPLVLVDDDRQKVEVLRTPLGVVAAIIPWNAPLMITCEKIGSALAAGNTVVVKPSPLAPLATLLLGQLIAEVVPPGVVNIVAGPDAIGEALVAHPDVAMVSFTGSTRAGQQIMATAAAGLKRLSLELGGNDPAIVLPDVDIAKTAKRVAMGALYRSGQVCAAIKRVYVHDDIADDFTEALAAVAGALVVGDPFDERTFLGPISNQAQFERVSVFVDEALAMGATAVTGGRPQQGPGYFYPPTLIVDAPTESRVVADEQFGPVLPLVRFSSIDEAVDAANDTTFGLGASVWTSDAAVGAALARRLRSGSAWVNRHGLVLPDVPFGGMKLSGLGRANGDAGLDQYCELQTVSVGK